MRSEGSAPDIRLKACPGRPCEPRGRREAPRPRPGGCCARVPTRSRGGWPRVLGASGRSTRDVDWLVPASRRLQLPRSRADNRPMRTRRNPALQNQRHLHPTGRIQEGETRPIERILIQYGDRKRSSAWGTWLRLTGRLPDGKPGSLLAPRTARAGMGKVQRTPRKALRTSGSASSSLADPW